jgi:DNA-binding SARP family transcriptional activator
MVRFWVLGRFAIEGDGAVLEPPRGSVSRSLLAWLLLHPGSHLRSRVAARFWPGVLDSSARASLRVVLSELRAALGPAADCLLATRTHVGIAAERVWVDALAFEELERDGDLEAAVDLCRGELLPDLDDEWVLDARDGYAVALVDVLGRLASAREAAGDLEAAISLSRRMVAVDPVREASVRDLMSRLVAAGEGGSAVAAYQRLAERLQSQLRLAPSPETRAFAHDLRMAQTVSGTEPPQQAATDLELAVSHFRQALERGSRTGASEARRGELLLGLGNAQMRAGQADDARAAFREAAELAGRTGDPELRARATLGLAGLGVTILDLDENLAEQLAEALDALPVESSRLRADLLARLAIARAYSPDRRESGRIAEQAVRMASSYDDPALRARALCAQHVALGGPEQLERRLETSAGMIELARSAGDRESELQGRNFLVADLLEAGDLPGFDREIEAYAALCHRHPLPLFRWYVPLWRATRATIDGRFDEAARLAARARDEGSQAGDDNADHFWRIQMGTLLLIERRFDGDTGWIEDHARNSPAGSAWWTLLAWLWAEQGRLADARHVVERLAAGDFAAIERDANWLPAIAELAQACRVLNEPELAATLYRQLVPFSGHVVTAARGAQAYGPVDSFLALVASTAGQAARARRHSAAALRLSESAGASAWADAAREQLAVAAERD